ncbi:hypothetical protein HK099_000523 [Clydaea vesicula]|uniref:cAMP-dependent protein kinase regulatory subunit n=1 Tax=Clydaea vesicula TaxID=447962 RepID=A0AAD5U4D0_9FUNG|nr:hypothetical protein HK099_000523 [Clydaea vesicula]
MLSTTALNISTIATKNPINSNKIGTPIQYTIPPGLPELLKSLNKEILREQPKNIYQFCSNYFNQKLNNKKFSNEQPLVKFALTQAVTENNDSNTVSNQNNQEANHSKDERMDEDEQNNETEEEKENEEGGQDEHEDDDDDDDDYEEMPPIPQSGNHNRNRRTSVSAESMAPTSGEAYVKVVIPKTEEQKQRIETSIKNNFLFKSLDEEQYMDVVDAMAEKKVMPGEDVIKQGGVGDFFYVAETGAFDVFVSRNGQPPVKVFAYGAGGSFGELALMYNAPRAATVTCTEESIMWALDRVTFRRILMENTSRKRRMYENFLEEVAILASLEPYERQKIADALESISFNDEEIIIKQGDVGDNFYIIEQGECRVIQIDENGVEHELPGLKKGDYFGELSLLTNNPRKATIVAKGRVKLATLGKKAFVRLLGPVVDILKRNVTNYHTFVKISLD